MLDHDNHRRNVECLRVEEFCYTVSQQVCGQRTMRTFDHQKANHFRPLDMCSRFADHDSVI